MDWKYQHQTTKCLNFIFPSYHVLACPVLGKMFSFLIHFSSYLNNESVSWVRSRDSHILTVDSEVFISDERFHSQIQKLSNLWILKVKATSSTTTIYFSQLNNRFSQPPKQSNKTNNWQGSNLTVWHDYKFREKFWVKLANFFY